MIVIVIPALVALIGLILWRIGAADWKAFGLYTFLVALHAGLLIFGIFGSHLR